MKKNQKIAFALFIVFTVTLLGCAYGNFAHSSSATEYGMNERSSFFYDSLQPYGRWFQHPTYGLVWYPYDLSVDWRPYTDGYWVQTDYGWTWVSNEPWGWACFHYGRWFFDSAYGWCWYPDTVWAPAWVFWSSGGDWIGWAPLPPEATWRVDVGLVFSDEYARRDVPRFGYCFVRRNEFFEHDLNHRVELRARNVTLINETTIISNNIVLRNGRVVNGSPDRGSFENEFKDKFKHYKLSEASSAGPERIVGEEVRAYRPKSTQQSRGSAGGPGAQPTIDRGQALPSQQSSGQNQQEIRRPTVQQVIKEQAPVVERKKQEQGQINTRNTVTVRQQKVAPDLKRQQDAEARALKQKQTADKRALEDIHNRELKSVPKTIAPQVIQKKHQQELKDFKEQTTQEQQLLRNSQQEEAAAQAAKQGDSRKHFVVPQSEKKADKGEKQQGKD